MNLGAEPKKIAWLAGIVVVGAGVIYYANSSDDPGPPPAPRPVAVTTAPAPAIRANSQRPADSRRAAGSRNGSSDWKPRLGPKNPEDRPDPATIDPTLHLALLAKVQSVELGPPGRNLFAFGSAPPPPTKQVILPPPPPKIITSIPKPGDPGFVPPPPPPAPVAPPMSFKYYGYKVSKSDGHKAAFLLDGEDILIAGENDTFKRRYKVVKIGVSSIVIEDTQFKSTQTLPLQENMAG